MVLSLSTVLHAERSTDVYPDNINVEIESGNILIYDRSRYTIKAQNEAEIQRNLNKNICKNTILRKSIQNGKRMYFVYMYKDGTLSLSVTQCY